MNEAAASAQEHSTATAGDGGRLSVDDAYAAAFAAAGLDSVEALFAICGGKQLGKALLPAWRERIRFELPGAGTLYMKRYSNPPVAQQLRRMLSGYLCRGTARLEWDRMRQLEAAGISGVQSVAWGEEMTGIWERRSAVVTAEVPGESLERYVQRQPGRLPRAMIDGLAEFVARFHRTGFVHRDLYLSHVFVDRAGERPTFRLIDLARMFRPSRNRHRWIVKELASLDFSTPSVSATAADRLRFLRTYLGRDRLTSADRRLIRRVVRKSTRIADHDLRRRRRKGAAS
jgi:hypothetical protein